MSEVNDLMVDVMMRSDPEAENAVIRLIQLAEAEELNEEECQLILRAVERRKIKVKPRSDLEEFMDRLETIIEGLSF